MFGIVVIKVDVGLNERRTERFLVGRRSLGGKMILRALDNRIGELSSG